MQKLLARNVLARNIVYLTVVLFTTAFLSDSKINPIYHLIKSFCIYLFITISTKMRVYISIILFTIFITLYIMHMYMKYFDHKYTISNNKNKIQYKNYNNILQKMNNILIVVAVIVSIYSFINFTMIKRKQYGKKFSLFKFLFGIRRCHYD